MKMYEITALAEPLFRGDAALGCITAVCAATDLCCGKVFNMVTVPGLVLGIVFRAEHNGAAGILEVLCAAGFTVLVLFPFYSLGGIGAGDIKLLVAVSAFIPEENYLRCLAGAFLIGAAAGIIKITVTKGKEHTVHFAVPVALSVMLYLTGVYN